MFKHRIDEPAGVRVYSSWLALAFLAGTVNSGGYLACHRFVSHVTGFATLAGASAAHGSWTEAIGFLTVPLYFLLGVMISAFFIDRRLSEGRPAHHAFVMAGVSLLLLMAVIGGTSGWFGLFGTEGHLRDDYFLLAVLCMAMGLQNAALTSGSRHTVRTTHLTGITTDLGIGLIRAISLPTGSSERRTETHANRLRVGTILAFSVGSAIGAILFLRSGYYAFLLPAFLAAVIAIAAARERAHSS